MNFKHLNNKKEIFYLHMDSTFPLTGCFFYILDKLKLLLYINAGFFMQMARQYISDSCVTPHRPLWLPHHMVPSFSTKSVTPHCLTCKLIYYLKWWYVGVKSKDSLEFIFKSLFQLVTKFRKECEVYFRVWVFVSFNQLQLFFPKESILIKLFYIQFLYKLLRYIPVIIVPTWQLYEL